MKFHHWIAFLISSAGLLACLPLVASKDSRYTAMYVFGDSLLDAGNNIYFIDSLAKANYRPYGIDFSTGPTGRFSNGKILVDFIAEMLGLPFIPSHANVAEGGDDILSGVNFASAGAGILNDTGYSFGRVIPLQEQIGHFKEIVSRLRERMQEEELRNYLARALVVSDVGTNDYLNNYMQPNIYESSHIYNPQQFAHLLVELYRQHLLELLGLGLRKFFILDPPPLGCAPIRARNGECDPAPNNLINMFNSELKSTVDRLNSEYPGSSFMLPGSFELYFHLRKNAEAYGFKVKDKSCCGSSNYGGSKPLCFRNSVPCSNRNEYIFWDAAHPTEAANRIIAQIIYNTTSLIQ